MSIEIRLFKHANASEQEYRALNIFRNQIRAEELPDDPPVPLEEMVIGLKNFPDSVEIKLWAAWEGADQIVGYGIIQLPLEDNLTLAQFTIAVLPEYRRQGLGSAILREIAAFARQKGRRQLIANSKEIVPAGGLFLERIGAHKGLEAHTNQLTLADVNSQLVSDWVSRAEQSAANFELGWWTGPYPESEMDAILALHDLFNQQPFGDLDIEEFKFTAEQLRQQEKSMFARGYERWTVFVREQSTGAFAGYSEVLWNPNRPDVIIQDITGVFPEFRNNGLGRWMKAAMLRKIRAERPQARFIRTGNADSNAPMLKINNELGFKPYIQEYLWQMQLDDIENFLGIQPG